MTVPRTLKFTTTGAVGAYRYCVCGPAWDVASALLFRVNTQQCLGNLRGMCAVFAQRRKLAQNRGPAAGIAVLVSLQRRRGVRGSKDKAPFGGEDVLQLQRFAAPSDAKTDAAAQSLQ